MSQLTTTHFNHTWSIFAKIITCIIVITSQNTKAKDMKTRKGFDHLGSSHIKRIGVHVEALKKNPKRYHDPVFGRAVNLFSPLRGISSQATCSHCGSFEPELSKRYQNHIFSPCYDKHPTPFVWESPRRVWWHRDWEWQEMGLGSCGKLNTLFSITYLKLTSLLKIHL